VKIQNFFLHYNKMKKTSTLQGLASKAVKIVGYLICGAALITLLAQCEAQSSPLTAFPTGGHTVYHLQPAKVKRGGKPAIVAATFDGTVLCYTPEGKLIWENKINNYFPFDLAVGDVDNDGLDETFVATAGGSVDAYDSDGTHLWSFN
jgi:hypothetical protein